MAAALPLQSLYIAAKSSIALNHYLFLPRQFKYELNYRASEYIRSELLGLDMTPRLVTVTPRGGHIFLGICDTGKFEFEHE